VQALRQALESDQTALTATEAGYEVGTRTAVDVPQRAPYSRAGAGRDYSGSRYDFIVSLVQLRLAAGNLDRAQLAQINGWLGVSAPTSPPVETPESLTTEVAAGFDDRADYSKNRYCRRLELRSLRAGSRVRRSSLLDGTGCRCLRAPRAHPSISGTTSPRSFCRAPFVGIHHCAPLYAHASTGGRIRQPAR